MTLVSPWLAAATLLIGCWLVVDGVVASIGWRGLRATPLHPIVDFTVAAAGIGYFTFAATRTHIPAAMALGAALLALPLHLVLALLAGRSFAPEQWDTIGSFEGHRIAAVELPASTGSIPALLYEPLGSSAGAIVVLHGAGAHKTFYNWPLFEALLHAGFAVCAVDLDGHGDNQRILDFPTVLEDLSAAVTWLRTRWSFVGVAGVSLGGCVAARAVAEGTPVDALALFEAPVTVDVTTRVMRHERWTLLRFGTWSLHRYAGTLPLIRAWATQPTRTRISTVDLIERLDICGSLRRIEVPVWLCYGASDWVVPLWQVHEIQAAAPPGTPLVLLSRATHLSVAIDPRGLRALKQWLACIRQTAVLDMKPATAHEAPAGVQADADAGV
jgi:pimeloyl-ACP methyl ester carboxylesterase